MYMNWQESTGEEWKGDGYQPEFTDDNELHELMSRMAGALQNLIDSIENYKPIDLNSEPPKGAYVLDGEIVRKPETYGEYLEGFESENRRVALDRFSDDTLVSTVFLGLDHSFGQGTPILFETMAWLNGKDYMQYRYPTYEAAITGHNQTVEELKIALANDL